MRELYNLAFEADNCLAKLLVNMETLEQIHVQLANVRQRFDLQTDEKKSEEMLNYPVIRILDDLFFYTLVDLNTNYETISLLVEQFIARTASHLENK